MPAPLRDDRTAEYERLARCLEWRRLPDGSSRFLHVFIEHNNTCNLKCTMCGFSDPRVAAVPRYHMPRWLFESIAKQVFPATTYLHMSLVTEPFMTADFTDRLIRVAQYGVPYSLVVTNGTLLTDARIEKILDAQITALAFSIDGGTKELYEQIRVGARFETVLRNVDRFKELRARRHATLPKLRINHVLMYRNVDHFDAFLSLLSAVGAEQVDVRTIQPMGDTMAPETKDQAFYEKVRRLRPLLADCCSRNGIEDCGFMRDDAGPIDLLTTSGARMTCRRPWDTMAILANGDVLPCLTWTRPPLGNLARQSFEEIWLGEETEKLRAEFERLKPGIDCQHCSISKPTPVDVYDDFFVKLVTKPPA
jgi:radical SAM protein with 4Fe4S-binding SPASM domain